MTTKDWIQSREVEKLFSLFFRKGRRCSIKNSGSMLFHANRLVLSHIRKLAIFTQKKSIFLGKEQPHWNMSYSFSRESVCWSIDSIAFLSLSPSSSLYTWSGLHERQVTKWSFFSQLASYCCTSPFFLFKEHSYYWFKKKRSSPFFLEKEVEQLEEKSRTVGIKSSICEVATPSS